MQRATLLACALIIFGVFALAYQGITYTTREETLDLGPLEVTTQRRKTIPLPPVVGAVCIVGGIIILSMAPKRA